MKMARVMGIELTSHLFPLNLIGFWAVLALDGRIQARLEL